MTIGSNCGSGDDVGKLPGAAPKVIVDNDRVTVQEVVWDAQNAAAKHTLDSLTVALTGQVGHVAFEPKGTAHGGEMGGKVERAH